ncbi:hypothetical protein CRENBAI_009020 [Crenichthys baileyi]|uniref:Uncharacterized protein n=1 Tax=Crenichthys baileyi TaxID=28760 RepID=A0AAV9RFW4_9TELE
MTEGSSQHQDQADLALELLRRIQQHEEEARAMFREDIEILSSPLLVEEIEETLRGSKLLLAPPGYRPGQNCSSLPSRGKPPASRQGHQHLQPVHQAVVERMQSN